MKFNKHKTANTITTRRQKYVKTAIIVFFIASVAFLAFKLVTFSDYNLLYSKLKLLPANNFKWLLFAVLLLPLNWLTESVKWKMILSKTQKISLTAAIKSVLAGFSTGFVTPNRLGDFAGRIYFLNSENRKTGITLSLLNSLTQNLAIALGGIPAAIIFFSNSNPENAVSKYYFAILIALIILFLGLYALLPAIAKKIKSEKTSIFIKGIDNFTFTKQIIIVLVSIVRFIVFSIQFYAMLRFFGVVLNINEAVIAIPASYLFVTFTPSAAFTDPVIRSSYAVIFVGAFSPDTLSIIFAGTGIWVVNYVFSMLIGNILIFRETNRKDGL